MCRCCQTGLQFLHKRPVYCECFPLTYRRGLVNTTNFDAYYIAYFELVHDRNQTNCLISTFRTARENSHMINAYTDYVYCMITDGSHARNHNSSTIYG